MKIEMPYYDTQEFCESVLTVELVDVAPHLCATFGVNRVARNARLWVVSNVETGYYIGSPERSRGAAIRGARARLRNVTQEMFDQQLEKAQRTGFAGVVTPPEK